jgi:hypothetical protein
MQCAAEVDAQRCALRLSTLNKRSVRHPQLGWSPTRIVLCARYSARGASYALLLSHLRGSPIRGTGTLHHCYRNWRFGTGNQRSKTYPYPYPHAFSPALSYPLMGLTSHMMINPPGFQ